MGLILVLVGGLCVGCDSGEKETEENGATNGQGTEDPGIESQRVVLVELFTQHERY